MGFLDDAKKLVDEHDDQVDEGIEKAGDLVDEKTGGKFADQVDKAQEASPRRRPATADTAAEPLIDATVVSASSRRRTSSCCAPGTGDGDEVLLQLRQNTGYMDDHWAAAAAGHVERGETAYDAAAPRGARGDRRRRSATWRS